MPRKIDANFANAVVNEFESKCLKPNVDSNIKKIIMTQAKNDMHIFAIAFNKLVDEGYFE